jgi:hypothetical protein
MLLLLPMHSVLSINYIRAKNTKNTKTLWDYHTLNGKMNLKVIPEKEAIFGLLTF